MTTTLPDFFNTAHEIEYKDEAGNVTVYRLKELTKGGEALFSRWLERRARDDAARAAEEMAPEVADRYMERCQTSIAAGVYEWESPASITALRSPAGQKYAIFLCLSEEHPDMTEELAEKIYAQQRKRIMDSLAKQVEDADPKVIAALRKLLNLTAGPQSSSATRRTSGSRGKSKKQRKRK